MRKIYFIGTSGVHHPLVAAYVYLNRIEFEDVRFLPKFCDGYYDQLRQPLLIARDKQGDEVYALGVGNDVEIGAKAIYNLISILGCKNNKIIVKPITVKGEKWFPFLNKLPAFLGGENINLFISQRMLKKEFQHIREQVHELL